MHKTAKDILLAFKRLNSHDLSTSKILQAINPTYSELKEKIKNEKERTFLLKHKRELASLHRKILWHLNKLVKQGLLRVNKYGEKGEKFFALNIGDDEEIVTEPSEKKEESCYKRKIVIKKAAVPAMPIDGLEQKGILFKFEPATWIDRLNSIIIFARHFKSSDKLYTTINSLFSNINDSLCIVDFDLFFNEPIESLVNLIEKLNSDCEDYGKKISLMLNVQNLIKQEELFFSFIDFCKKKNFENIYIIFNTNSYELNEYNRFFEKLIDFLSKTKMSFFIKNKDICQAPYFLGRAGPYCIDEKEWKLFSEIWEKSPLLACSQSSVLVDINRFIKEYGLQTEKFTEFMMNIVKALLSANSLQRRSSEEYFRNIVSIGLCTNEFLMLSRNYVRLWNYNLSAEQQEKLLVMLNITRKKIDEFAAAEETIYKSCGMSTRFKIALSCAFKEANINFSEEAYQRLEVECLEDFHKKEIKKDLKAREKLCDIFDGGNRVGVYRTGKIDRAEIVREIAFLLSSYKIPFLAYNFKNIKGNLKLNSFFKV